VQSQKTDIRKITRGFQVTLPKGFRERHGLEVGDVVEMVESGGELRVQPVEVTRKRLQDELDEIFTQVDAERDTALAVSTEEEALALAEEEIQDQRQSKSH
jgi:AbrB family looped-hinge helix DNA binding protein